MSEKIKIAVSSCLLGEAVRYDGTDKKIQYITETLASDYNLVSLCPEMAIGMGVPRDPIHLVETNTGVQVLAINDVNKNMTAPLLFYADKVVSHYSDICGYIFKKNSPSCGTKNVKVLNSKNNYELKGKGIYAEKIMQLLPMLPVIDEEDCLDNKARDKFLSDVSIYSINKN